jgi:hypothetical protein
MSTHLFVINTNLLRLRTSPQLCGAQCNSNLAIPCTLVPSHHRMPDKLEQRKIREEPAAAWQPAYQRLRGGRGRLPIPLKALSTLNCSFNPPSGFESLPTIQPMSGYPHHLPSFTMALTSSTAKGLHIDSSVGGWDSLVSGICV